MRSCRLRVPDATLTLEGKPLGDDLELDIDARLHEWAYREHRGKEVLRFLSGRHRIRGALHEIAMSRQEEAMLRQALSCSAVGSPDTVRRGLTAFIERTQADELIIASQIHDHGAHLRSLEITGQAREAL